MNSKPEERATKYTTTMQTLSDDGDMKDMKWIWILTASLYSQQEVVAANQIASDVLKLPAKG